MVPPMNRWIGLAALLVSSFVGETAHADGGYFSGTRGTRAAGRSGAFTARADDVSAVELNPAGLAHLDATTVQVGNRFSYNAQAFKRAPTLDWGNAQNGVPPYVEFETVENQEPWVSLSPFIGAASSFGLDDWTFALAFYSPAGTNRASFPIDGGQRYMMVSLDVAILKYAASAAWQLADNVGIGATLQWITVPWVDYSIVIDGSPFARAANPVSSDMDVHASISGSDAFIFNAILGGWYRPVPAVELGLAAQVVPTAIETDSELSLAPVGFDEEPILQRNDRLANDVDLTLPLPLWLRAGVRYRHLEDGWERFDVELDFTYETWSRVDRFTLDAEGLVATIQGEVVDVGVIEIDKSWQDTVTLSLGSDYVVVRDVLSARGGLFYASAVAPRSHANVDFTGGQQLGGSLGASIQAGAAEVGLAYEYRHQLPVRISEGEGRVYQQVPASTCQPPYTDPSTCNESYLGQPSPAVNAGRYSAHSHVVGVDVLYRF